MLDEAVQIMRRLWTEDEVDFAGHHFVLDGAISQPKPVQDPHIPIWVAGGGEQLTLQVAARYADYTNFGSDIDDFIHKSKVLANHCERLNTDYRAIVRSSNFLVVCEDSEADVAKRLTWINDQTAAFASEAIAVSRTRGFEDMAGTPDQLIERLQDWNAAGLDYGILYFAESAYDHEGLDRFGAEVMPALRSS